MLQIKEQKAEVLPLWAQRSVSFALLETDVQTKEKQLQHLVDQVFTPLMESQSVMCAPQDTIVH